jgi:hypothetical protein
MFSADNIQARLREAPFIPFRIVMSSGQSYDIGHPELVWVNPRYLMVATPSNDRPGQIEAANRVSLLHVSDL